MVKPGFRALASAYTLTEMLVVLVIIGLLAAIVGPRLFNRLDEAKRRTAELQMKSLQSSIDLFRIDVGRIPSAEEGLDALVRAPTDSASGNWLGPYLAHADVPMDPWGHAYVYAPTAGSAYRITSLAADGRAGGAGAGADLVLAVGEENASTPPPQAIQTTVPPSSESLAGP